MQEITVYTTRICAFCDAAKRLLTQKGYSYKDIDLTDKADLRIKLSEENRGWRTVPMIFIGTDFIGGFTELAALDKTGELDKKVKGE